MVQQPKLTRGRKAPTPCKKCGKGILCFHDKLSGKEPMLNPILAEPDHCIEVLDKLVADTEKCPEEILKWARNEVSADRFCVVYRNEACADRFCYSDSYTVLIVVHVMKISFLHIFQMSYFFFHLLKRLKITCFYCR